VDTSVRSSDGTRLTVRRLGAGITVVLLHGSGGGLHSWQAVADQLADRYELWLVCRRGCAPSDVPAGPNSFPAEVADVHAVLDAVGAPRPTWSAARTGRRWPCTPRASRACGR
jgi:pimeloyl-ACP methyl ester carboxylesterase